MEIIKVIKKYTIHPFADCISSIIVKSFKRNFTRKNYADLTEKEYSEYWDRTITMSADELWSKLQKFRKEVDVNTYIGAMSFVQCILKDK